MVAWQAHWKEVPPTPYSSEFVEASRVSYSMPWGRRGDLQWATQIDKVTYMVEETGGRKNVACILSRRQWAKDADRNRDRVRAGRQTQLTGAVRRAAQNF